MGRLEDIANYETKVAKISEDLFGNFDPERVKLRLESLGDEQLAFDVSKYLLILLGSVVAGEKYGSFLIVEGDRVEYERARKIRHPDAIIFVNSKGKMEDMERFIEYVSIGNPARRYYEERKSKFVARV